ncbi:hypothetical protein CCP4SC76_810007 [Gammaproteobacteria bacterium]
MIIGIPGLNEEKESKRRLNCYSDSPPPPPLGGPRVPLR